MPSLKKILFSFFIFLLIFQLLITPPKILADPIIDQQAGFWQDDFSDSEGISSSNNIIVSDGNVALNPFSVTQTTKTDFDAGTKINVKITNVSGGEKLN